MAARLYPCPCCGYLVFDDPPGSDQICPICFWQDDDSQLRFPTMGGGANRPSLLEAQANVMSTGACEPRFTQYVREVTSSDRRDPGWRILEPSRDPIETPIRGIDYGASDPDDRTTLYDWRAGSRGAS